MIPKDKYEAFEAMNCSFWFNDFRPHAGPVECEAMWDELLEYTSSTNFYDLYQPAYFNPVEAEKPEEAKFGKAIINGTERTYKRGYTAAEYTPWAAKHLKNQPIYGSVMSDYANTPELRAALFIPDDLPSWEPCWDGTHTYQITPEGSKWIYPILKANGIKMMFYSGDTDGAITTWGTKRWIKKLGWPLVEEWRTWKTDGQVSGYIEQYDGLDFVTVKGVGHMAPQYKRKDVTQMITNWIHGEPV